jgi:hypothetical protein
MLPTPQNPWIDDAGRTWVGVDTKGPEKPLETEVA